MGVSPEPEGGFVRSFGGGPDPAGRSGGGFPNPGGKLFTTGAALLSTSVGETEKEKELVADITLQCYIFKKLFIY